MGLISGWIDQQIPDGDGPVNIGIDGYTLFARISDNFVFESEVPGTPVERGDEVNDHIILKPLRITITGNVSDVVLKPSKAIAAIQAAQAEIGNVSSQYASPNTQAQLQKISEMVNQVFDAINKIDNAIATGSQALDLLGDQDDDPLSQQKRFIKSMEYLHTSRSLASIDMPGKRRKNMRITMFSASTDSEADSTDFTLEAKEVLFAEVEITSLAEPSPGLEGQTSSESDQGSQVGEKPNQSLLSKVLE